MDAETLTALKQSIEKWERNAVAETPDGFTTGPETCALCGLFWRRGCNGCPVRAKTGYSSCLASPYVAAAGAKINWRHEPSDTVRRDAAHTAARAEVAFLRSLLPEEETTP